MDDLDIYRAANAILNRYSAGDAVVFCAQRADAMVETGNMVGRRVWQRIGNAVTELMREPREDDAVN